MTDIPPSQKAEDNDDGHARLRAVIVNAINNCPPDQRDQLRRRFVEFAAGLPPEDLEVFEQAMADLNEGADVRIERELERMLQAFLAELPQIAGLPDGYTLTVDTTPLLQPATPAESVTPVTSTE